MVRKKHAYVEELEGRFIKEIRYGRATSRLELATRHQLAPSTVGIYVDRLLQSGHLREDSSGQHLQPGRPALKLSLRGEAGLFVGVEFEARNIHAVCVDFSGKILNRVEEVIPSGADAPSVMAALQNAIDGVIRRNYKSLLGIGVGVPGLVDPELGVALHYRFIQGWKDIPVAQRLRERYKVPIHLENNARATAKGIMLFEPAVRKENFVCLLVRSGVGAGIVVNGQLHRGANNLSGEVGRIVFQGAESSDQGETLEDVASINAILRFVRENAPRFPSSPLAADARELSIAGVIEAANDGDELARESLRRAIYNLGWLAHLMVLIENPGAIVLSGPLNALGDWLRLEIQASLANYLRLSHTERPVIALSALGAEAGALGASSLAIDAWKPVVKR